jgi:hypothetical protein
VKSADGGRVCRSRIGIRARCSSPLCSRAIPSVAYLEAQPQLHEPASGREVWRREWPGSGGVVRAGASAFPVPRRRHGDGAVDHATGRVRALRVGCETSGASDDVVLAVGSEARASGIASLSRPPPRVSCGHDQPAIRIAIAPCLSSRIARGSSAVVVIGVDRHRDGRDNSVRRSFAYAAESKIEGV